MVTNLSNIPKKQAIFVTTELILEELETLIKTLNHELTKLKGIKTELLKIQ